MFFVFALMKSRFFGVIFGFVSEKFCTVTVSESTQIILSHAVMSHMFHAVKCQLVKAFFKTHFIQ